MSRLVLGTAQLGSNYGVANTSGQPDQMLATEIVRAAWEGGIREFDTAQDYGESEKVLGGTFKELGIASEARVVTKLTKDIDLNDMEAVSKAVKQSIANLGVPKLYALLLHKEELLDQWQVNIADLGIVQYVGVSVYNPGRVLQALAMNGIDMVQIPTNILDRRFENAGVFERANENKKQIYIRSAFLQGLILMDPNGLPENVEFAKPVIEKVIELTKEFKISPLEMALGYLKIGIPQARIIVGAEKPEQIREIITAWERDLPLSLVDRVRRVFVSVDKRVLNPSFWTKSI